MAEAADREAHLPETEALWRRVPPYLLKGRDEDPDEVEPQGNAFRPRKEEPEGLSVDRATIHQSLGRGPESLLDGFDESWGVLETTVAECAALALEVVADPLGENPAHALIRPPPNKTRSRTLSKTARWAVRPRWP